ncbi:MAG: hypothetical protein EBZ49_06505 [Proteobacteria bacterium]|nr:hypothetical protein [Pseudomonadota bacterium]
MPSSNDTVQFSISVTGESTGEKWTGAFKCKTRLSHRDQLRLDQVRRDLLGPNPEGASPRAQNQAEVFSFIVAHLIDAPNWWRSNDNGLDLEDDNVVAEVYAQITKAKADANEKLRKAATEAEREIKAEAQP